MGNAFVNLLTNFQLNILKIHEVALGQKHGKNVPKSEILIMCHSKLLPKGGNNIFAQQYSASLIVLEWSQQKTQTNRTKAFG